MSKKSRKRNKLILAALGATALVAKRKRNAAIEAGIKSNDVEEGSTMSSGSQHPSIAAITNTPKVVVPKAKAIVDTAPVNKNTFRTRGRITDSAGNTIASAGVRPDKMPNNPPPSIGNPYSTRTGTGPRRFASGGRATYKAGGTAKRGVSPILLKGKK